MRQGGERTARHAPNSGSVWLTCRNHKACTEIRLGTAAYRRDTTVTAPQAATQSALFTPGASEDLPGKGHTESQLHDANTRTLSGSLLRRSSGFLPAYQSLHLRDPKESTEGNTEYSLKLTSNPYYFHKDSLFPPKLMFPNSAL